MRDRDAALLKARVPVGLARRVRAYAAATGQLMPAAIADLLDTALQARADVFKKLFEGAPFVARGSNGRARLFEGARGGN